MGEVWYNICFTSSIYVYSEIVCQRNGHYASGL